MKPARILFAAVCLLHTLLAAQTQQPPEAQLPPAPPHVIFRPTFLTADLSFSGGIAFRLKNETDGRHYLVAPHSLFGPAARLDVQMTAEDIQRVIVGAVGVSCVDPGFIVFARPYIYVPGARPTDKNGAERDLALFRINENTRAPALTLDPAPQIQGDVAWLFIKYSGTADVGLEPVVVAAATDKEIRYLIKNQKANLAGITGAPILGPTGQVIAMHIGTFTAKNGYVFGYGVPASSIRSFIEPPIGDPRSSAETPLPATQEKKPAQPGR